MPFGVAQGEQAPVLMGCVPPDWGAPNLSPNPTAVLERCEHALASFPQGVSPSPGMGEVRRSA